MAISKSEQVLITINLSLKLGSHCAHRQLRRIVNNIGHAVVVITFCLVGLLQDLIHMYLLLVDNFILSHELELLQCQAVLFSAGSGLITF